MGKAPAFQFYSGDWIQDTRILTPHTRGIWIDMLCFMWRSSVRGKLEGTIDQYARLLSCKPEEIKTAMTELSVTKTADVTECNDFVTVVNRRMFREEKERESTRYRVQRFRNGQEKRISNESVTVPSSSSSSSSSSKKEKIQKKKKYSDDFISFWTVYPNRVGKDDAWKAWQKRNGDRPPLETILSAIKFQIDWRENANGEFRPEWKNPSTWINKGCWADEISIKPKERSYLFDD